MLKQSNYPCPKLYDSRQVGNETLYFDELKDGKLISGGWSDADEIVKRRIREVGALDVVADCSLVACTCTHFVCTSVL